MTVRELREVLNHADPEEVVKICVNTPGGWVCPDGCAGVRGSGSTIPRPASTTLWMGLTGMPLNGQIDFHKKEQWTRKRQTIRK